MKPFCLHICEYYCDECDGEGISECPQCGNDADCDACDGTGFDDGRMDVEDFRIAVDTFSRRDKAVGGTGRIEDLFEKRRDIHDNVVNYFVGRKTAVGEIRFSDFDRDHRERTVLQAPDMTFGIAQGGHRSLLEDLP